MAQHFRLVKYFNLPRYNQRKSVMRSIDWFQGPCPQRIPDMRLEPVDLAKKSRVTGNMVIHTYSMYVWDDVSYSMLFLYYMMLVSWKGTKKNNCSSLSQWFEGVFRHQISAIFGPILNQSHFKGDWINRPLHKFGHDAKFIIHQSIQSTWRCRLPKWVDVHQLRINTVVYTWMFTIRMFTITG